MHYEGRLYLHTDTLYRHTDKMYRYTDSRVSLYRHRGKRGNVIPAYCETVKNCPKVVSLYRHTMQAEMIFRGAMYRYTDISHDAREVQHQVVIANKPARGYDLCIL